MSKLIVLEGRSVYLITTCLGLLVFVSALSVLVTDEALSSMWAQFAASVLNAQTFLSQHTHSSPQWHQHVNNATTLQHDDPACLSRTQQYLYRNPPNLKPLPAPLLQAWASYTQMHKSCSHHNWTELFLHRDQHSNEHNGMCQYLVYIEAINGLGNGILSLTSAFAFAMATSRVLLIDSRKNLAKLLCEPFPESSWVLPQDFPYADIQNSASLGPLIHNNFNESTVSLNLRHTLNEQDQQIFCEETYSSLKNVKWAAWTSNQYFIPNFLLVPSFWQRIHPMFKGSVDHIFTFISRLLVLPANDTWAIILREYWSYLSCAKSRLGVQVRLHGRHNLAEFDTEANDKIMKCLVQNGLLPSFSEGDNTTELSTLYNRKLQPGEDSADIVVMLASLQGKYSETMKDHFGQMPTKGTKMVRVHSVSQLGSENKSFQQAQLAFVEMWLLSYSDNLATSPFSTFGYIAQGLGHLHPFILSLREEDHNGPCVLGQSAEPCTHYPRAPRECLGANAKLSEDHKQWIRAHFRSCQDHERGWQLVHGGAVQNESNPIAFDFL